MRHLSGVFWVVAAVLACDKGPDDRAAGEADVPGPPVVAEQQVPESRARADTPTSADTADWQLYEGDGFSFAYPPEATLGTGRSHPSDHEGLRIMGPEVRLPTGRTILAYDVIVSVYELPAGRSLEQWVDSIIEHEDVEDWRRTPAPRPYSVAGLEGFISQPFCGDCEPYEVYLEGDGRFVVFSYLMDVFAPRSPERAAIRAHRQDVVDGILSSFRWR